MSAVVGGGGENADGEGNCGSAVGASGENGGGSSSSFGAASTTTTKNNNKDGNKNSSMSEEKRKVKWSRKSSETQKGKQDSHHSRIHSNPTTTSSKGIKEPNRSKKRDCDLEQKS